MRFGKGFFKAHAGTAVRWIVFALVVAGLFMGCGGCGQCSSSVKKGRVVLRTPSDISDFSVVFVDGKATLYWIDSTDSYFDHVEISWKSRNEISGDEKKPITVEKGVETCVIPDLEENIEYTFTLTAVDTWGNKSDTTAGGTGKAIKQRKPFSAEDMNIKGTPIAEQAVLSWTNLNNSEYDHVEITYDPNYEALIRVPKGIDSKMLTNLVNGVEHTFYIRAVDARGNPKPLSQAGIFISDLPTSPESVFGRASGGQVVLAWENPSNPRYNYIETTYTPDGETPVTVARDQQTRTLTDLSDITDYEFSVYAVDTSGRRRPVTNVNLTSPFVPTFDGKDANKIVVRGRPVGGQIKLEWEDPLMQNLSYIAINYQPRNDDMPLHISRGLQTMTFNGLADGREYRFLVYGVDSQGNNRVIPEVKLFTPRLRELVAHPVSGRVTLAWENPEYPHFNYIRVSYEGLERPVRVAKGAERFTFTGLSDLQEYKFRVTAITTEGDIHAVASARVNVPRLPVLSGTPVDGQLSLAWIDPTDIILNRVEIITSPGDEEPQPIVRGMESVTFSDLSDDTKYSFTIYAVDNTGNRYPVLSPKFYDPNATFVLHSESVRRRDNLRPLNWKASNNAPFGNSTVNALSFGIAANGTPRWVAGGSDGKLVYSNDYGLNWAQVNDSTFGSYSIDSIHYANGRWIASGRNGKIAWSTNGIIWNAVRSFNFTANFNFNVVTFADGRWMAGGSNGSIITSEDNGVSWRRIADALGQSAINTLVFHEGRWMAGGMAGKMAYSDDNGITWTPVENNIFGNSAVNVILYDHERWLAGGYTQRMAWSEDAITWQMLDRPFYILCMGFNGFRWIAGGQRGRMAWSHDGGDSWISDEQVNDVLGESWIQAIAFGRTADGKIRWFAGGQNGKIIYADEQ